MENNENKHEEHNADGDRQVYPKGWWMPLIGILIIALGFTSIGAFAFSASGTERWGKTEQCEMKDGKCCAEDKACAEGKEEKDCKDKGACMSTGTGEAKDTSALKVEEKPAGK